MNEALARRVFLATVAICFLVLAGGMAAQGFGDLETGFSDNGLGGIPNDSQQQATTSSEGAPDASAGLAVVRSEIASSTADAAQITADLEDTKDK